MDATQRRPRKSDAERGPLGAWTYRAIVDLRLTAAQVAHDLGVHSGTIGKLAGGSYANPSAELLNRMYAYFREVGASRQPPLVIDPPPGLNERAGSVTSGGTDPASLSELAQAIREMAEGVRAMMNRVDLDRVEKNEIRIGALEAQMAAVWSAIHPEPAADGASQGRHAPRGKGG